jgi:plastocyanin
MIPDVKPPQTAGTEMDRSPKRAGPGFAGSMLLAALLLLTACTDIQAPGGTTSVSIRDNQFMPQTIIVSRGATVRWNNIGAATHTSVATGGAWNSGNIPPTGSFSHTFRESGTFTYRCAIHTAMNGTIIVD